MGMIHVCFNCFYNHLQLFYITRCIYCNMLDLDKRLYTFCCLNNYERVKF